MPDSAFLFSGSSRLLSSCAGDKFFAFRVQTEDTGIECQRVRAIELIFLQTKNNLGFAKTPGAAF